MPHVAGNHSSYLCPRRYLVQELPEAALWMIRSTSCTATSSWRNGTPL
jgi:hypothetical protein